MTTGDLARTFRHLNNMQSFVQYVIVFHSGERAAVRHPETISQHDDLFVHCAPDRSYRIFSADGVSEIRVAKSIAPARRYARQERT